MTSIALKTLPRQRLVKSAPPAVTVRALGSGASATGPKAPKPVPSRIPRSAPLLGSAALSTLALAAVGVAAALFPMALFAAVPVAILAVALAGLLAKRRTDQAYAACLAAREPAWPTSWKPTLLAPDVLRQAGGNPVRVNAAKARHYLQYLATPGVFTPDALLDALAHARGANVRLWVRVSQAEDQTIWASPDGAGYQVDVPRAKRTVHLVHEVDHYWSLRLADGVQPHKETTSDGTTLYQLITAPNSPTAVEVQARADGDCLFHAWAAAENYNDYNGVHGDVAQQQARAHALRALTLNAARARINTGDTALAENLAGAAESELNVQWKIGTEALANARNCADDPDILRTCVEDAKSHLLAALRLITFQQTQARAQVLAMLRETWQVERRLLK